jgi:ABC-type lipoprotein release transport system permease subunit
MKNHFIKRGWIYLPVSVVGWIITVLYAAVAVYTLTAIQKSYNSIIHSLIRFFPYFISFSVVWFWIASNMGKDDTKK